ncbi:MAG: copper resistance protein B [Hyphomonadaceae bacterium]|nr:copper resistance protein B [Hyphomonadaceae bacterium]
MKVFVTALTPILLTIAPAAAQDHSAHTQTSPTQTTPAEDAVPHAGHDMQMPSESSSPAAAGDGPASAADLYFDPIVMARAREQLRIENGEVITHAVIVDRLEATSSDGVEGYAWDVQAWYGGDINRLWWKSEGEGAFDGDVEHAELQFLYSRAVTPYFNLQGGVRQTSRPAGDRTDLVLGIQGLAPYWFEVDGDVFVSNEGELTARAQAEYDLRLTQRLILQPRGEVSLSAQDIPEFAIGSGVTNVLVGARLRYEITRSFAPYVGVEWSGAVGDTRNFIQSNGDDPNTTRVVLGVRALF